MNKNIGSYFPPKQDEDRNNNPESKGGNILLWE